MFLTQAEVLLPCFFCANGTCALKISQLYELFMAGLFVPSLRVLKVNLFWVWHYPDDRDSNKRVTSEATFLSAGCCDAILWMVSEPCRSLWIVGTLDLKPGWWCTTLIVAVSLPCHHLYQYLISIMNTKNQTKETNPTSQKQNVRTLCSNFPEVDTAHIKDKTDKGKHRLPQLS